MKNFKKSIKIYFLIIIVLPSLFFSYIWVYDPLQVFHQNYFKQNHYLKGNDLRIQLKALIDNLSYDSLIFGTSMLQNTSVEEANKKLGGNFINISTNGIDFYERKIILEYVLEKKDIKSIIYSLDYERNYILRNGAIFYPVSNYNFLYDNNPLNDFKIYLNEKYLNCLLKFSFSETCVGRYQDNPYELGRWNNSVIKDKFNGMLYWNDLNDKSVQQDWRETYWMKTGKYNLNEIISNEKLDEHIETNIISLVKKYQDTYFYFVIPPYSRHYTRMLKLYDKEQYNYYKDIIKILVEYSNKYKNLKLISIDDTDINDDIKNYKDFRHYHHSVNSIILSNIAEKRFINKNNLNIFLNTIDLKNDNSNLDKDIEDFYQKFSFNYGISENKVEDSKLLLRGWVLYFDKIDEVVLKINKSSIKTTNFHNRDDVSKKYPQYKESKVGFVFEDIVVDENIKYVTLEFKSKGKLIETKKVKIR